MNSHCHGLLRRGNTAVRLVGLLALAAACIARPSIARADDDLPGRVGRVAEFGGELYIAPQDRPDQWTAIGLNYPVTSGDNLWVANDGHAEIDFGGGQFRVAGSTNLHVSRLDDRNFALFVAQGGVILRVRVLDPGDAAHIDTPNAQVMLTRPGLYRIEVSDDRQHTQLAVREGEANVLVAALAQQVLPGQSAGMDGADPQDVLVRNGFNTDGFDAWSAERDLRYERNRASSYVSRQMVGYADLDEYGTWETLPDVGAVWYPSAVAADWAPYRDGYWTDVGAWGPTWVDASPWGYAPFHYGRWANVRGRWGWCPGSYVARPMWAPALVGWVGGPGWGLSAAHGGPVYGWVPLGWGEAYRPSWGRCSRGCQDRYNHPYAVSATERASAPPTHFINGNVPGALTAVPGAAFASRKPVQGNRVNVPGNLITTAPVLPDVPLVRPEPGRIPGIKPGNSVPPPASTAYATGVRRGGPNAYASPNGSPGAPSTNAPPPSTRAVRPGMSTVTGTTAVAPPVVRAAPAGTSAAPAVTVEVPQVTRSTPTRASPPVNVPIGTSVPNVPVSPPSATTYSQPTSRPPTTMPSQPGAGIAPPSPSRVDTRTPSLPTITPAPPPASPSLTASPPGSSNVKPAPARAPVLVPGTPAPSLSPQAGYPAPVAPAAPVAVPTGAATPEHAAGHAPPAEKDKPAVPAANTAPGGPPAK